MIDYGIQQSTIKPDELEFTESKVFVATNITEVSERGTDEEPGFNGYSFQLVEYSKDEYIRLVSEKNSTLEKQLVDTQLALCEVYELMA
jgi:hypothetical protein